MYLPGEMIQFDSCFSNGLVETTNQFYYLHHGRTDFGFTKVSSDRCRIPPYFSRFGELTDVYLPSAPGGGTGAQGKNGKSSGG